MRTDDRVAKAAASKVYRKVSNEVAEVAGVRPIHTSFPSQDFTIIKTALEKRLQDGQALVKMWAEQMIKAGLRPRFPRFD
jgi:hypothetical protein